MPKKTPPLPQQQPAPTLDTIVRGLAPSVRFTNLEKVLYPEQGITKGGLAAYYAIAAERILPHLKGRPVTLVRCPDGAGEDCFFQKQFKTGVPGAIQKVDVAEPGAKAEMYMEIHDVAGLLGAVQLGSLELHVWGSRTDALEKPDQLVFDLDPDPSVGWAEVVQAAVDLRDLLAKLALKSWVKTTGGKGLHVVVPVAPEVEWPQAKDFTESVAEVMVRLHPGRFTTNIAKAARPRKIFIDYLRNGRGATAIAPYSTRARSGAPVATPVTWEELGRGVRPDAFHLGTVPQRIEVSTTDPWKGFFEVEQSLEEALRKIERG